ncbi:MAG: acetate--CoA ligase [Trueperaceae bacterium]|nr:acetate--CoA ligase [Trueperaceae bacterium]
MAVTATTTLFGFDVIRKGALGDPPPNLPEDGAARAAFDWDAVRAELDGLPAGGLNLAHEAVDRHAAGPLADREALRWLGADDAQRSFTYRDLKRATARFANALEALGVERGTRVFCLLGRVPELYVAALGTLKRGAVFAPLFSAFGPEPIQQRMEIGEGRVLVTSPRLYRRKVAPVRDRLPGLEHVILVPGTEDPIPGDLLGDGVHDWNAVMDAASEDYTIAATDPESLALLHFTSGTTGLPKGAMHVHQAAVHHYATGLYALDFHDHDVFWCTADPGWVTGTSYGILAPLLHGITNVVDEAEFDAERWYRILQEQRVTVWYTAPTAVRMLMKVGADVAKGYDLSRLRFIGSVGEPLNPEAVVWGNETFGMPIHDNWWQTETGGIMIANTRAMDVKPGSMGRPLPGITAGIVAKRDDGGLDVIDDPDVPGELALRPGWPSMFRGYLHREERYRQAFRDGWYLTGDLAKRDADGYFWFVGRADDLIKSAGHLIGPFEVESALIEHPAVAEAGVIGVPDPVAGELVKAFVTLAPGYEASDALKLELIGHGRKKLGPAVAPKMIEIVDALPHTRSGKIMRRLLKARELGLPEGDTSTLENAPGAPKGAAS